MNLYTAFLVSEHMESLLDEAAKHRVFKSDKPSLFQRIASAASKARELLNAEADYSRSILPTLDDYPYRV
jgi:hypothetical protein